MIAKKEWLSDPQRELRFFARTLTVESRTTAVTDSDQGPE